MASVFRRVSAPTRRRASAAPAKSRYQYNAGKSDRAHHPVNGVTWEQAQTFCEWAGGRLPTEAEWEYAARSGGKNRKYPWGDRGATCERAIVEEGGAGCGEGRTWPVCSKPSGNTEQGLCDMGGNLWEWVSDWYSRGFYAKSPRKDPIAPGGSGRRVIRGGGFNADVAMARVVNRRNFSPGVYDLSIGFRCVSPAQAAPTTPKAHFQVALLPDVPDDNQTATWPGLALVSAVAARAYEAAVAFERSEASAEDKAARWKELGRSVPVFLKFATKREALWSARARREDVRERDWAKLAKLLKREEIPESDKRQWVRAFAAAYGASPSRNPHMHGLARYVTLPEWITIGCRSAPSRQRSSCCLVTSTPYVLPLHFSHSRPSG